MYYKSIKTSTEICARNLYKMLRVLIAEDEPDTWIPYKILLEKRGQSVDVAEDGEQCIEKYMRALKDVVKKRKSDNHTSRDSKTTTRSRIGPDHTLSPSHLDLPPF